MLLGGIANMRVGKSMNFDFERKKNFMKKFARSKRKIL